MLELDDAVIVFKTFREFHDIARRDYPSAIETRSNSCEQRHVGQNSSLLVTHNTSNLMQILCSQHRSSDLVGHFELVNAPMNDKSITPWG